MFHNYADAVHALRAAVAERGEDFVYPDEWKVAGACQYVVSSSKDEFVPAEGCIVGMVLAGQGINLEQMHEFDGKNPVKLSLQELRRREYTKATDESEIDYSRSEYWSWEDSPATAWTLTGRHFGSELFDMDMDHDTHQAIRTLLRSAQSRQDKGKPWGEAVKEAEKATIAQYLYHGQLPEKYSWLVVPA